MTMQALSTQTDTSNALQVVGEKDSLYNQERSSQVTYCKGGVRHDKKGFAVSLLATHVYTLLVLCVA